MKMKGTTDEFEVIHVHDGEKSYRVVAAMPWLIHIPFKEDSFGHKLEVFTMDFLHLIVMDRLLEGLYGLQLEKRFFLSLLRGYGVTPLF